MWPLAAIFWSHIENMKNAYKQLFYAKKKKIHLHQVSKIRIYSYII